MSPDTGFNKKLSGCWECAARSESDAESLGEPIKSQDSLVHTGGLMSEAQAMGKVLRDHS